MCAPFIAVPLEHARLGLAERSSEPLSKRGLGGLPRLPFAQPATGEPGAVAGQPGRSRDLPRQGRGPQKRCSDESGPRGFWTEHNGK